VEHELKMSKNNVLLLATLASLFPSTMAFAQDEPEPRAQYTVGLRVWNAAWSTALPTLYSGITPGGVPGIGESLDNVDGKRSTSAFPTLSMRKDRFLVSASYARYSTDFFTGNSVFAPNGVNVLTSRSDHVIRKESDITAGYFIVPNVVAISLGFKYATEDRSSTLGLGGGPTPLLDNTARAILLGASAGFPIQGALSFSGQLAYGPARVKTRLADQSIPDSTNNSRYLISEIGLNYGLDLNNAFLRGASIGLAYRSQLIRTKGLGPSQLGRRTYRDEREGIVATLNVSM
jgi:hypothetical protein